MNEKVKDSGGNGVLSSLSGFSIKTSDLERARQLSPLRNTTLARDVRALVAEQLGYFSIESDSELGRSLGDVIEHIYRAYIGGHGLSEIIVRELALLDRSDRIAYFNAKKFLCFQIAKLLETL